MNECCQLWHKDVLALHHHNLHSSLLYEHNVQSETLKEIEFTDTNLIPIQPLRGYFVKKDNMKYWIDEQVYNKLPIKVGTAMEELKYKEDIVFRPLRPVPFKIVPQHSMSFKQLVDSFCNFTHTNEMQWKLIKIIALASFIGRTYICVSSNPEFGKSSVFEALDFLTDKSPAFKPRSVPGVLNHINGNGNIIFDDVLESKKEVRDIMEEMNMQLGSGKAVYINGAMKSNNTKSRYNCRLQSITYLYNNIECYKRPETNYFDNLFENNNAIDTRFLKLKMNGCLSEKFDRGFNIEQCSDQHRKFYLDFAKELLYLQELKQNNGYKRRYNRICLVKLRDRKRIIYDEITWCIDMYCDNENEYEMLCYDLDMAIIRYKDMVDSLKVSKQVVMEEVIE